MGCVYWDVRRNSQTRPNGEPDDCRNVHGVLPPVRGGLAHLYGPARHTLSAPVWFGRLCPVRWTCQVRCSEQMVTMIIFTLCALFFWLVKDQSAECTGQFITFLFVRRVAK